MALKCDQCGKVITQDLEPECIMVSEDGDFVCSKKCEETWKKERDNFFDNILPNDKLFAQWLGFPEGLIK